MYVSKYCIRNLNRDYCIITELWLQSYKIPEWEILLNTYTYQIQGYYFFMQNNVEENPIEKKIANFRSFDEVNEISYSTNMKES